MSQPLSLFAQKTSQTQLNCFDQKKKNTAELHGAIPQAFLMQTCTTNNATLDTDQIKLKKIKHVTYCTVFCHTYSCVIKTNPEGAPRHVLHTCLLIIFSCQISLFFYFLPIYMDIGQACMEFTSNISNCLKGYINSSVHLANSLLQKST